MAVQRLVWSQSASQVLHWRLQRIPVACLTIDMLKPLLMLLHCSKDGADLIIYLNYAVAERVAYTHKQPGRWPCARTGDKPGGSQRHRKPHLHAPGMLMQTKEHR